MRYKKFNGVGEVRFKFRLIKKVHICTIFTTRIMLLFITSFSFKPFNNIAKKYNNIQKIKKSSDNLVLLNVLKMR